MATILMAVKLMKRVSNTCPYSWPSPYCLYLDKITFCACFTFLSEASLICANYAVFFKTADVHI